jgi:hypothetical protein
MVKSPTRTVKTQSNHYVTVLWSFVKIELLRVKTNNNHYQLKAQLYFSAQKQAFEELHNLQADFSIQPSAA